MRYAAVRDIPEEHKASWPECVVLPEWASDSTAGDDDPTMVMWEIWFQGMRGNKSAGLFIWKVPGWRDDWPDVSQRLARRAGGFGLTCVYIYDKCPPCTKEMYEFIVQDNKKREAEIIKFRKQEAEWRAKHAAAVNERDETNH